MVNLHPAMAVPTGPIPQGPVEEFEYMLAACKRKSVIHTPHRDFIIASRLLEWFRSRPKDAPEKTNAGRLLMAVYGSNDPPNLIQDLVLAMNSNGECWLKVFTILLQLGKGTYIEKFWNLRILDHRLPITEDDLCEKLHHMQGTPGRGSDTESKRFAKDFVALQYQLCTADSLDSTNGRVFNPVTILPVCTYEPIKPDGSAKIFQIEVPCGCIPNKLIERIKTKPYKIGDDDDEKYHKFALKVLPDERDYIQETFAYRALKGREGVVQCLGFWELKNPNGGSEFHLLLEFGQYDLHEYFENFPPPSLPRDIIQFWKDLSHVAIALDRIHNMQHTVEGRTTSYFGWHCDIKPENILFCKGGWKIADPGFAQFIRQSSAKYQNELPVTKLRGGTTTYGPPEQTPGTKDSVTQRFDIWSLGCVLSESATWLLLGCRGVEQFRLIRKSVENGNRNSISFNEPRGDDCFHNNEGVSEAVLYWHGYLRHSLREGDRVTPAILDFIESQMLIQSAKKRTSSSSLVRWLKTTIESAEKHETLSKYQPPPFFRKAFEAEQRKIAEEWANPPQLALRRSNRYKSMRFQNEPGALSPSAEMSPYDQANIHTPLLTAPFPNESREQDLSRGFTVSSGMTHITRNSLAVMTHGNISPFDVHQRHMVPYENEAEDDRFDYWDALHTLEGKGWVPKGTIERRQDDENAALPSPPLQISTVSPTPSKSHETPKMSEQRKSRLSQFNSARRKSLLTDLFSKQSSLSKKAASKPPSGPLTAPQSTFTPPYDQFTPKVEMDKYYKNPDFDEYFDKRDVVFLFDNGSTMGEHWPRARELVAVIVALLHGQDDNGMEIYFTSSTKKFGPFTEPKQFTDIINRMRPRATEAGRGEVDDEGSEKKDQGSMQHETADDIRDVLQHILSLVGKKDYDRKLTLIILTDGIWKGVGDKKSVAKQIANWLERWEDRKALKKLLLVRGLSLQFVQFGNDPDATEQFEYMDDHLAKEHGVPDIIDVEPATGNVKKMILGSLSTEWDDGAHTTVTSDESLSTGGQGEWNSIHHSTSMLNSPSQYHDPRFPDLYEDPFEYSPSNGQPTEYNFVRDTALTGAQFGPSTTTLRSQGPPSSAVPRQMSGQATPSRNRKTTKDSASTMTPGGRDVG